MRVAMITGAFPERPDAPVGGVAAATMACVKGLLQVRPDLDLHVVLCPADAEVGPTDQGDPPYTLHRLWGRRSGVTMIPGFTPRKRIERLLRDLKPDVVHVQASVHYIDARCWPAVLTVHGIRERDQLFREVRFARMRSRLIAAIEQAPRRRYRHVIAISGYTAQYLEGRVTGRVHFIPNAIDPAFFERRRREAGPVVLFAGPVWPLKNLHGIIEAVGLLARDGVACTFRAAGPVLTQSYRARLQRLIDRWGVGDRVEFLGNLDHETLRSEMETARCLVLPSFQENAPMVVAEAGAMGVPQVVAPAGGAAEMIVPGYSGFLVDPHSPASIADGLRPLLEAADLAARFGERAREMAQVHRPQAVGEKTLAVYDAVLREASRQ